MKNLEKKAGRQVDVACGCVASVNNQTRHQYALSSGEAGLKTMVMLFMEEKGAGGLGA